MKFIASRLSEGNKVFPAEIHLEENGLTVKIPGLFSGRAEYFDYARISNISVNTPVIGYSTITFRAAGARVTAHGFSSSDVRQIKQAVELAKTSSRPQRRKREPEMVVDTINRQPSRSIEPSKSFVDEQVEATRLKYELQKLKEERRKEKIETIKESYGPDSRGLGYYLRIALAYLDEPWKKVVVGLVIFYAVAGLIQSIGKLF